jgi:hypothetical protein
LPKKKPPGTVTHQIFLPEELHKKVATVAPYGSVDDLIIECVAEAMEPRWQNWLRREVEKIEEGACNSGKTSAETRQGR